MRIVIPTRNRVGRQDTLKYLPVSLRERVLVVCPAEEVDKHREFDYAVGVDFLAQPRWDMTIAKKRQWIIETLPDEYILMMDDDLRGYMRISDNPPTQRYADEAAYQRWLVDELQRVLSPAAPIAGWSLRGGNHVFPPGWEVGSRVTMAMALHLPTVRREVELGRIETREDYDINLQLLRKGYENHVCGSFAVGQVRYGQQGGASDDRGRLYDSDRDAELLAELHDGYVDVVARDYKTNQPRLEVVCHWKRALRDGKQWRRSQAHRLEAQQRSQQGSPPPGAG